MKKGGIFEIMKKKLINDDSNGSRQIVNSTTSYIEKCKLFLHEVIICSSIGKCTLKFIVFISNIVSI